MANHPNRSAKWLKGLGGTEFLQFAYGRITRESFPMGGYIYTTSDLGKQFYRGNDYEAAKKALPAAVCKITTA